MVTPVPGAAISATYRQRGRYWSLDKDRQGLGVHTGIDYAASVGTPILSCTPGRVATIDRTAAYGNRVGIETQLAGETVRIYYCHLRDGGVLVRQGQSVTAGMPIGLVGATGNVTGAHLHLEMRAAPYRFSVADFRDPLPAISYSGGTAMALSHQDRIDILTSKFSVNDATGKPRTESVASSLSAIFYYGNVLHGMIKWLYDRHRAVLRSRTKPDGSPAAVLDELDGDLLRRQNEAIIQRLDQLIASTEKGAAE